MKNEEEEHESKMKELHRSFLAELDASEIRCNAALLKVADPQLRETIRRWASEYAKTNHSTAAAMIAQIADLDETLWQVKRLNRELRKLETNLKRERGDE